MGVIDSCFTLLFFIFLELQNNILNKLGFIFLLNNTITLSTLIQ